MKKTENKNIILYIVCHSTDDALKVQKDSIIELCRSMNKTAAKNNDMKVNIKAVGYVDPEHEDVVTENFIEKNAKIVVFLFDKGSDVKQKKRMEDTFNKAVNKYNNFRRPEILVYLPDDEKDEDIEKLLRDNSITIKRSNNNDELKKLVEDNILTCANSYMLAEKIYKQAKRNYYLSRWYSWVIIVGSLVSIIYWVKDYWSQQRILIAGGGSAKNLIEEYAGIYGKSVDVTKGTFRIYAPLPTGDAYHLLTEETEMNDSNYHNRNYYTVILSAGKAEDYKFLSCGYSGNIKDNSINDSIRLERLKTRLQSISDFRKTGVVMGIFMGWDSLALYSKGHDISARIDTINFINFIRSVRNTDSTTIYTTNSTSGTFKAYKNIKDSIPYSDERIFYNSKKIDGNSWVALGSVYYGPHNEKDDATVRKTIIIGAEPKPIYVYFMRYRNVKKHTYDLPEETENYLINIGIPQNLIEKIKNDTRPATIDTAILFDDFSVDTTYKNSSHIE